MNIIKPLSEQITLSTANTVSNASLVYIIPDGTNDSLITINDGSSNTGSLLVRGSSVGLLIEKEPTWTVQASNNVSATSVAYKG